MSRTHRGDLIEEKDGYRVIHCQPCGFAHLDPIPSRDTLAAIYPRRYYEAQYPDWIEKSLSEKAYWMLVYAQRYETFERFVRGARRRLLDVGSFLGFFLEAGRSRGWETLGIEPSSVAARHARESDLQVLEGFFEDFDDAAIGALDVIHLSLTLEHLPDPIALLERAHRLLRPGGLVCLDAPNDFNPLQDVLLRRLGKPRYWLAAPHHINYFSFETLSRLVERMGFKVVERETTFPMELFVLMGEDYIGNDTVGRQCHRKRMQLETHLIEGGLGDLRRDLYRFLASCGVGRNAVIYAQRTPA